MFETKFEPVLSQSQFLLRMARSLGVTMLIVAPSLLIGTVGYHVFGGLTWVDALLNAAMILTGMGPVDQMPSTVGKLFSTFYALYSGIAFLTMMAVILAPLIHRLLHTFAIEDDDEDNSGDLKSQSTKTHPEP
ncbi:hypothetical protein [Schlesneria paludicola]|uniref:hypothetical protein n=1 Tax=Schlesneria paludicola TaxID=360056 RepID=UPI00029AB7D5|nr:hypothetical protein [Schlesneria paludicola]